LAKSTKIKGHPPTACIKYAAKNPIYQLELQERKAKTEKELFDNYNNYLSKTAQVN
jgi:hypothetical protein